MIEALNEKPFKNRFNDKLKNNLVSGLQVVEIAMIDTIKRF